MDRIGLVLKAAGASFEDVVMMRAHFVHVARDLPVYRKVRQDYLKEPNDHRKSVVWNPFMRFDPNVKNTFSGPDSGVGAVCSWEGNSEIGAGTCTIIESKPGELVWCRMDWKRPMEGTSTVDFTFKPEGAKTLVTVDC